MNLQLFEPFMEPTKGSALSNESVQNYPDLLALLARVITCYMSFNVKNLLNKKRIYYTVSHRFVGQVSAKSSGISASQSHEISNLIKSASSARRVAVSEIYTSSAFPWENTTKTTRGNNTSIS